MRRGFAAPALTALLALGGCATVPASLPFATGDVTVDVLDRDTAGGTARIVFENHTRQRLGYTWPFNLLSTAPVAGERTTPGAFEVDGVPPLWFERPLAPGGRQILEVNFCREGGECRSGARHVGVLVCRRQRDYCTDYEIVWSTTPVAEAPERARPAP